MSVLFWLENHKPSDLVIKRMSYTLYTMAFIAVFSVCVAPFYSIAINLDHSLPQHAFIIHKGETPKKGEFIAFKFQGFEPWFPKGSIFVKILSGTAGDIVSISNKTCIEYKVSDTVIGCAKPKTSDGHALLLGPVGVVPKNRFVVRGTSPDSFDSRYDGVGWIKKKQVIGRAYAIF